MAISYVAYSNGLQPKDAAEDAEPIEVGADVNKSMFEPEDWDYLVLHGAIVRKGGPHDPEVLAAANEPEEVDETSEDPRDTEIRQLREALALYVGRGTSPAPGDHLADVASAENAEESKPAPKAPTKAEAPK